MAPPDRDEYEDGGGSPAPPPPPPPPPQEDADDRPTKVAPPPQPSTSGTPAGDGDKPRRVEYRELFALFHAEEPEPVESKDRWDHLWQLALVEAREEFRLQQLEKKKPKKRGGGETDGSAAPTPSRGAMGARQSGSGSASAASGGPASGGPSSLDKRPRPPAPGDNDPNKAMRVNRPQPPNNRPKGGASKLMQKLGGRSGGGI